MVGCNSKTVPNEIFLVNPKQWHSHRDKRATVFVLLRLSPVLCFLPLSQGWVSHDWSGPGVLYRTKVKVKEHLAFSFLEQPTGIRFLDKNSLSLSNCEQLLQQTKNFIDVLFVFYCCHNKLLQTQWLKQREFIMLQLHSSEVQHPLSAGLCSFLEALGENPFNCLV